MLEQLSTVEKHNAYKTHTHTHMRARAFILIFSASVPFAT